MNWLSFRGMTDSFRGIYGIYTPQINEEKLKDHSMERWLGFWPILLRHLPRHCIVVVYMYCSLATTSSTPLIVSGSGAGASRASSSLNLLLSSSHQSSFMKVEPSLPQLYLTRFLSDGMSQNQLTLHTQLLHDWSPVQLSGKILGFFESRSLCFQDQPVSCWHLSVLSS